MCSLEVLDRLLLGVVEPILLLALTAELVVTEQAWAAVLWNAVSFVLLPYLELVVAQWVVSWFEGAV